MKGWWRRLIDRADDYYDRDWRVVWYQPILYLFIFGACIRLALYPGDLPQLGDVFGTALDYYALWLAIGLTSPLLVLASWFLIRKRGRLRVAGMGARLAGDLGILTLIFAYHITTVIANPVNESRLVSRYIVAASMVFVLELVVRDYWAIRLNEIRTHRIRRLRDGR